MSGVRAALRPRGAADSALTSQLCSGELWIPAKPGLLSEQAVALTTVIHQLLSGIASRSCRTRPPEPTHCLAEPNSKYVTTPLSGGFSGSIWTRSDGRNRNLTVSTPQSLMSACRFIEPPPLPICPISTARLGARRQSRLPLVISPG